MVIKTQNACHSNLSRPSNATAEYRTATLRTAATSAYPKFICQQPVLRTTDPRSQKKARPFHLRPLSSGLQLPTPAFHPFFRKNSPSQALNDQQVPVHSNLCGEGMPLNLLLSTLNCLSNASRGRSCQIVEAGETRPPWERGACPTEALAKADSAGELPTLQA